MTTALDLNEGEKGIVKRINGGYRLQAQLNNLGIHEDDLIEIKRKARFGPLLITVHNSNVAIGRGIASKIEIEKYEGD